MSAVIEERENDAACKAKLHAVYEEAKVSSSSFSTAGEEKAKRRNSIPAKAYHIRR